MHEFSYLPQSFPFLALTLTKGFNLVQNIALISKNKLEKAAGDV